MVPVVLSAVVAAGLPLPVLGAVVVRALVLLASPRVFL